MTTEMDNKIKKIIEESSNKLKMTCLCDYNRRKIVYNTIIDVINEYICYNSDYPFSKYTMVYDRYILPRGDFKETFS